MERRDFLEKLGIGAAFVLTSSCLGACSKTDYAPTGTIDFTVDLAAAANSALAANGGYIIDTANKVVVARDTAGNYVAATQVCSHEGNVQVIYNKTANSYQCTAHGATFDLLGKGTNSNGSKGLTIYKTTLTGTKLRVYS
ncbi:MAG: Rieske 2Fe-2S domain-containing protein [Saprospiraceae bacterium]|nr:Rieske 2Fe-2S domain-containing protein [Saprospiraceae bacterium]